eukprot:GHVL01019088.1.p1 GENE.GHVL01019088.1~~GHVL01019088.1.p1  ORF type:complete len:446 (+),score=74.73 GHVL01019088.1:29-1366(+)
MTSVNTINIPCTEISSWLCSRRKIPSDWSVRLKGIHVKISKAIENSKDGPEASREILQECKCDDVNVNFLTASRILEALLRSDEAKSVNLIGQHSSEHIQQWNSIIKAYKQKFLNIAEAGTIIAQNCRYEIPATKRSIDNAQKQIQSGTRRAQELEAAAAESNERYLAALKTHNVSDPHGDIELQIRNHSSCELKIVFEHLCDYVQSCIIEIIECYQKACEYVMSMGDDVIQDVPAVIFPILQLIAVKGNPPIQECVDLNLNIKLDGDLETEEYSSKIEVVFQDSPRVKPEIVEPNIYESTSDGGICWDIPEIQTSPQYVESPKKKKEPTKLLDNVLLRNMLLDEVHELKAFFDYRLRHHPPDMEEEKMRKMQNSISKIVDLLSGEATQSLILMQNKINVEALKNSLVSLGGQSRKNLSMAHQLKSKNAETAIDVNHSNDDDNFH